MIIDIAQKYIKLSLKLHYELALFLHYIYNRHFHSVPKVLNNGFLPYFSKLILASNFPTTSALQAIHLLKMTLPSQTSLSYNFNIHLIHTIYYNHPLHLLHQLTKYHTSFEKGKKNLLNKSQPEFTL